MMTQKKSDSIIDFEFDDLSRIQVSPESTMFYRPEMVERMGKKLAKDFYLFDNFIFRVRDGNILSVYYGINHLIQNPKLLRGK